MFGLIKRKKGPDDDISEVSLDSVMVPDHYITKTLILLGFKGSFYEGKIDLAEIEKKYEARVVEEYSTNKSDAQENKSKKEVDKKGK